MTAQVQRGANPAAPRYTLHFRQANAQPTAHSPQPQVRQGVPSGPKAAETRNNANGVFLRVVSRWPKFAFWVPPFLLTPEI
jgi:hypothetical protein